MDDITKNKNKNEDNKINIFDESAQKNKENENNNNNISPVKKAFVEILKKIENQRIKRRIK